MRIYFYKFVILYLFGKLYKQKNQIRFTYCVHFDLAQKLYLRRNLKFEDLSQLTLKSKWGLYK